MLEHIFAWLNLHGLTVWNFAPLPWLALGKKLKKALFNHLPTRAILAIFDTLVDIGASAEKEVIQ